jgi:hypothetical protein
MSPNEAWYGKRALSAAMHIWGCHVLVPNHDKNKSENHAALGQLYGYAKTHSLLHWINPVTDAVKHEHVSRFLNIDPTSPFITFTLRSHH